MLNFDFKRSSSRCSISGREFEVGEQYISVLVDDDGQMVRQDICTDRWTGPPKNCIGWWQSRVPDLTKGKVYWAPRDVLISFFDHLLEQGNAPDKTYVMAILLMQKKHLKLLDTTKTPQGEVMELMDTSARQKYEIPVIEIGAERIEQIQTEFAEKLFTDIVPSQA